MNFTSSFYILRPGGFYKAFPSQKPVPALILAGVLRPPRLGLLRFPDDSPQTTRVGTQIRVMSLTANPTERDVGSPQSIQTIPHSASRT